MSARPTTGVTTTAVTTTAVTAAALALGFGALLTGGCAPEPEPDRRNEGVGYRSGTEADDWRSSGERGNVNVTEVFWSGSVRGTMENREHFAGDVFIELQNKHPRPMNFNGWILQIESGLLNEGRWHEQSGSVPGLQFGVPVRREYVLPQRVNGRPVEANEFVVIAASRTGAFGEIACNVAPPEVRVSPDGRCWLADYYIDDLVITDNPFELMLMDSDERLVDQAGDSRKRPFAGAWDLVTARSMERIQVIFNNRGNRDMAWHSYSLNTWDTGDRGRLHEVLRRYVHPDFRALTYATPGMPNSPDYSGFVSSGDFQ